MSKAIKVHTQNTLNLAFVSPTIAGTCTIDQWSIIPETVVWLISGEINNAKKSKLSNMNNLMFFIFSYSLVKKKVAKELKIL